MFFITGDEHVDISFITEMESEMDCLTPNQEMKRKKFSKIFRWFSMKGKHHNAGGILISCFRCRTKRLKTEEKIDAFKIGRKFLLKFEGMENKDGLFNPMARLCVRRNGICEEDAEERRGFYLLMKQYLLLRNLHSMGDIVSLPMMFRFLNDEPLFAHTYTADCSIKDEYGMEVASDTVALVPETSVDFVIKNGKHEEIVEEETESC